MTHAALMANASAMGAYGLGVTAVDRAVSWLPLYHDMGLIGFLLTPMAFQTTNRPVAHRRLRAPAPAVADADHPQRRHGQLCPDLRL